MIVVRLAPLLLLAMAVEVPPYLQKLVKHAEAQFNWYAMTHEPVALKFLEENWKYIVVRNITGSPMIGKGFVSSWTCVNYDPRTCTFPECNFVQTSQWNDADAFAANIMDFDFRPRIDASKFLMLRKIKELGVINVMQTKDTENPWEMTTTVQGNSIISSVVTKWSLIRVKDTLACNATIGISEDRNKLPEYSKISLSCYCPME